MLGIVDKHVCESVGVWQADVVAVEGLKEDLSRSEAYDTSVVFIGGDDIVHLNRLTWSQEDALIDRANFQTGNRAASAI